MNRVRIILGYLFGFITAFILVILALFLIMKFTVCDKNYILNIFNKNNYYQKIDEEIKEEMSLYILSSGFDDEIYKDVYEYDNLIKDINSYIDSVYNGEVVKLDTSSIHENITNNVKAVFKKSNVTYNNSDLTLFIDGLVNVYSDEVMLYHFTDGVIKYVPKIINIVNIGIIVSSILLAVMFIVLIIIKYRYFIATIISSGLIILFLRLFVLERIDVNEILIITEKFSEILRIILNNISNLLLYVGLLFI